MKKSLLQDKSFLNNVFNSNITKNISGSLLTLIIALLLNQSISAQGVWTQLTNLPPDTSGGGMLLLSDGTIMCKTETGGVGAGSIGTVWNKLTPDIHGSYINGTWTALAPMANSRLYFSSQVLKDGRVYVAGGEYGTGGALAEMYNPITNTWTSLPNPGGTVSDANSEILPDGRVLQAMVNGSLKTTLIYNPVTNVYIPGPTCLGIHNESAWVKQQDNSILFVDRLSTNSERYIPALNTWTADATVPVNLYDPFGDETGAGLLLPDGRSWFLGSTGKTAFYTPSGTNSPGTWATGPVIPNNNGTTDAMADMMPNGKILCVVNPTPTSANHFPPPSSFYEFDYTNNSYTQVNAPYNGLTIPSPAYIFNLINLPNGQVLLSEQDSKRYYVYTPGGTPLAAGQPTINNILQSGCTNFTITGLLFNGISEGSAYGDDWQNATNYPIVQLTNGTNVYYARSFNWNRTGVQTGNLADTAQFTLPVGLPHLTYSLCVIVNGISSTPVQFTPFPILNSNTVPNTVCTNSTFTYTPSGPVAGSSFSWTRAAVAGISNPGISVQQTVDPNEILVNTTSNPINVLYSYSISAPSGCSASEDVTVTVVPLPTISVIGTSTVCSGDNDVLTANGGNTYVWSNSATGSPITINPTSNSVYSVTGTDANGCSNTQQFAVSVNPKPNISVTGKKNICEGDSTLLTANGSNNYVWSNNATTNTIMVMPSVNTTYSVSSTNALGCTATFFVQIVVADCTGIKTNVLAGTNGIAIYPNPAEDYITVAFRTQNPGTYNIKIQNILGQIVFDKNDAALVGNNSQVINLEGIAKGVYVISIKKDADEYKTKITIK